MSKSIIIYINIILIIVLQAVYEGLYDLGRKTISKYVQFVWWLVWFAFVVLCIKWQPYPIWQLGAGFVALWFVFFDVPNNLVKGNRWNYESPSSGIYYKIMWKFKALWPGYLLFLVIMAIYGSFVILRDLRI